MKRVTIEHVAKKAGVGLGTVSRVLNGGSVSAKTKQKVLQVIKELGYSPSIHARTLAGGKTQRIMFIFPEMRNEFHWRLLKSFDLSLDKYDYETVVYPLISDRRLNKLMGDSVLIKEVDAIVMTTIPVNKVFQKKFNPLKPVVLIECEDERFDSLNLDNKLGGRKAAEILLEHQPDHFFAIQSYETNPMIADAHLWDRLNGFKEALAQAGYELPDEHIVYADLFTGPSHEEVLNILSKYEEPGIFALTDNYALIVLQIAYIIGKKPGKDFFLVGFDDQFWSKEGGLTTIRQPVEEIGSRAAEIALKRIREPNAPIQHVKFIPEVVRRETA
mgnify:CR=1 FL=1